MATMPLSSKKRSHSINRSDLPLKEQKSNDFYQPSHHNNNLFPIINSSSINHNSSTKNLNIRPKLYQYIDENIIGKDYIFQGPWGLRRSILFRNNIFLFH